VLPVLPTVVGVLARGVVGAGVVLAVACLLVRTGSGQQALVQLGASPGAVALLLGEALALGWVVEVLLVTPQVLPLLLEAPGLLPEGVLATVWVEAVLLARPRQHLPLLALQEVEQGLARSQSQRWRCQHCQQCWHCWPEACAAD
jgi:hypothetical protein